MGVDLTAKIDVTVNISAGFKDFYSHLEDRQTIELEQPETVQGLIRSLGISSKMVLLATVNDRIIDKQALIEESCEINLVSPPAGG